MEEQHDRFAEPNLEAVRIAQGHLFSDSKRAIAEFESLASAGSMMSLHHLGYMHEMGIGTDVDIPRAEELYERAYSRGSTYGALSLGRLSWKKNDYSKAQEYFQWGVGNNDPRAMYWLAELQFRGHIQLKDGPSKAVSLLKDAAALGHLQSRRKLGKLFMSGNFGIAKFFGGLWMFCSAGFVAFRIAIRDPSNDRLLDLPGFDPIESRRVREQRRPHH